MSSDVKLIHSGNALKPGASRARCLTLVWVIVAASTLGACGPGAEPHRSTSGAPSPSEPTPPPWAESSRWIDVYEPELAAGGYNLLLYQAYVPVLMDMNGTVVHSWDHVQAVDRARLLRSGHLAVIVLRGPFAVYDWDGKQTWSFEPRGKKRFLHHDFAQLRNGNWLLLVRDHPTGVDLLLEIDEQGQEIWQWNPREHIGADLRRSAMSFDLTHINSVQEIPPNRWFDEGYEAFRPGNVLVSARNLDTLYVVERPTGEIVWRYDKGLDYQHEARMVPRGLPGAGNIVFFNNGYNNRLAYRRSSVVELDPIARKTVWQYQGDRFFSSVEGTEQVLENGNLLVTSSQSGRVFEVTREGRIVWQWAPPFHVSRTSRYAYDFCPQLAAMDPPSGRPIRRRDPEQYVDSDLYRFGLVHERRPARDANGVPFWLLEKQNGCRVLRLPDRPMLEIGYGVRAPRDCRKARERRARFQVTLSTHDGSTPQTLLEDEVELPEVSGEAGAGRGLSLRRATVPLEPYRGQTVELCLALTVTEGKPPPCFVWELPSIHRADAATREKPAESDDPEIQEIQRQRLEALGYVN